MPVSMTRFSPIRVGSTGTRRYLSTIRPTSFTHTIEACLSWISQPRDIPDSKWNLDTAGRPEHDHHSLWKCWSQPSQDRETNGVFHFLFPVLSANRISISWVSCTAVRQLGVDSTRFPISHTILEHLSLPRKAPLRREALRPSAIRTCRAFLRSKPQQIKGRLRLLVNSHLETWVGSIWNGSSSKYAGQGKSLGDNYVGAYPVIHR